jgi:hypothetical protein
MAAITISAFSDITPLWTFGGTTCVLRLYYTREFVNSDAATVLRGDLENPHQSITCDVSPSGVIQVPEIVLSSTTDGTPNNSSLTGVFFDDEKIERITFFSKFAIPSGITTTTWPAIFLYNQPSPVLLADEFYNKTQTNLLITEANSSIIPAVVSTRAVLFNSTKAHHVNHGRMWNTATIYTSFFWEALIKPDGSAGYFISGGYGGAHLLLFGLNNSSNGYQTITGNVAFDGASTSFSTNEGIRVNEWAHVAVAGDASTGFITVLINGVPSSIVTGWGGQRRVPLEADIVFFAGGSHHLNYGGTIACIRGFEGTLPYPNPHNTVVRPAIEHMARTALYTGSTAVQPCFLADYRTGTLEDKSAGLSGVVHNGFFAEAGIGDTSTTLYNYQPYGVNRVAANRPTWVTDEFTYTSFADTKTPLIGARIYHGFGGADKHYGNNSVLGLGNTEVGNLAWQGNPTNYGQMSGAAFCENYAPGIIFVSDSVQNCEIRLYKPYTSAFYPPGGVYRICFNVEDTANYNMLYADEFGSGYIIQVVAGAPTVIGGSFSFGTTWNYMKVVISGTTVDGYADNTLKGTRTITANLTKFNKGFELGHPAQRVSQFAVL